MPTLKEFEKKGKKKPKAAAAQWSAEEGVSTSGKNSRRPGRKEDQVMMSQTEPKDTDADDFAKYDESAKPKVKLQDKTETPKFEDGEETPEFHLEFPYSGLVKMKFPKGFEVAEKVAKDWTEDGDFNELPIEPVIAQFWVGEGLRRAKKVEKKLDQLGVLPLIKYQVTKIKEKIQK